MMSDSKQETADHIARLAAVFLAQYNGYRMNTSEEYTEPSRWNGGSMTLTITITCPTGAPPLTPEQVEAKEAARKAAQEAN